MLGYAIRMTAFYFPSPQVKEGVNVYRFANRIPLLFEAGSDVVTRVATKRIK